MKKFKKTLKLFESIEKILNLTKDFNFLEEEQELLKAVYKSIIAAKDNCDDEIIYKMFYNIVIRIFYIIENKIKKYQKNLNENDFFEIEEKILILLSEIIYNL